MTDPANPTTVDQAPTDHGGARAARHEDARQAMVELVADGSIEFSSGDPAQIEAARDCLPFGTPVFVPVLPRHDLASRIALVRALRQAGLDPVPHLAARRLSSRTALVEFLAALRGEAAVHRVLVIGGDAAQVSGPWSCALDLLRDDILTGAGVTEVVLAGYPEGHPAVPPQAMETALLDKLACLESKGQSAQLLTQFSFMPSRIVAYCARLASLAPDLPVYVGLAGPARLRALVHFARYCGVAASLSAVNRVGVRLAQLVDHRRADEQLEALAQYNASHSDSNVIGVHLFSFGGFVETAQWMRAHLDGGVRAAGP